MSTSFCVENRSEKRSEKRPRKAALWSTPAGRRRFHRLHARLWQAETRRLAQRFTAGELSERGLRAAAMAIPRRMERVLGPVSTWPRSSGGAR